ncbi:MAG: efflux RND transporter permease subunit, partial [Clostridia bacterium]|nr:efflux RND transporter permease subunit [Clostridia bacterium]
MKRLLKSIIETRKVTLFFAVVVSIMGIFSYHLSPKQQSPKLELATALITTVYSGATADDIEKMVTSKIEDKLAEFEECEEILSYSRDSVSVILYTVKYSNDFSDEWDKLRREMTDLQSELPKGAETIHVNTDFMMTAGMIYSISGTSYTYDEIKHYAEILKEGLNSVDGISRFEIEGHLDREIVVELDYQKMNYLDISYEEISSLIAAQNLEIPSGQIEDGISKINVRTKGFFENVKDIENIIVSISDETGIVTRIKDIGTVSYELEDSGFKAKINKNNAVFLVGYFEEGKNIIPIGKEIENNLLEIRKNIPEDIEIDKILFEPNSVNDNLTGFIHSLLQGIVFVILVVFVGMGFRNAIIVSIAIPLSIFLTFSIMKVCGVAVQQISIVALIIALGMLVDNAIVVSDAIQNRIDHDEERINACVNGVLEVAAPVLTSTITTVCTFMPLLIMKGEIRDYLKSLPIVVIAALLSSYLVALTVTPTMAYLFFKKRKSTHTGHKLTHLIETIQTGAMKNKHLVFITLTIMIVLTIGAVKSIGLKFFPFAQTDMMYIDVKSEITSDLDRTEEVALQVVDLLEGYDEIEKLA